MAYLACNNVLCYLDKRQPLFGSFTHLPSSWIVPQEPGVWVIYSVSGSFTQSLGHLPSVWVMYPNTACIWSFTQYIGHLHKNRLSGSLHNYPVPVSFTHLPSVWFLYPRTACLRRLVRNIRLGH